MSEEWDDADFEPDLDIKPFARRVREYYARAAADCVSPPPPPPLPRVMLDVLMRSESSGKMPPVTTDAPRLPVCVVPCAKCGKAIGFDVAPRKGKLLLCRTCTDGWNAWAASQRGMASGLHEANEPRPEPPVEPDHLTPVLCTGDFMRGPELDPRRKR